MKAKLNRRLSWEKQTVWDLENGWRATEGWNQAYGPMLTRLEKDGAVWHCHNGLAELPEFARSWVETVVQSCNQQIVRPAFTRSH